MFAVSVPWLSSDPLCVHSAALTSMPFPCCVPWVVSFPASRVNCPLVRVRDAAPVVSVSPVRVRPLAPCQSPPLFRSRPLSARVPPIMRPGLSNASAASVVVPALCTSPVLVSVPVKVPVSPDRPFRVPLLVSAPPFTASVSPCRIPALLNCPPCRVSAPPESPFPVVSLMKRVAAASMALVPCIRPLLRSSVAVRSRVLPATVPLLVRFAAARVAALLARVLP